MRTIIKIIVETILPKQVVKPVGRWNIDYCKIKTNNKIDWANEDHCGPCGEYALRKNFTPKNTVHTK
jgi:hypothetical protein